jgi:acetolactate decarboxylase
MTTFKSMFFSLILLAISLTGCRTPPPNGITQVATIDALLTGVYDGHMTLADLHKSGDFGIGTFEALDGEMILLEGHFYQIRSDGRVYHPADSIRTPFACVTWFNPHLQKSITAPINFKQLEKQIDSLVPLQNQFCAFTLRGSFSRVRTRSVPAQKKPYPPLVDVTKNQPVFELGAVRGTLIGFRAPAFVKGINVPGYHLHFLADDRSGGGHVLDFEVTDGTLEVDSVNDWLRVYLPPESQSFGQANLTVDRSSELNAVEK